MSLEEIKFEDPTDLLEKVKSHGGKVFETLYYWQSFDPDNNIRILEEVIEYVERNNHNQKVFEIIGEGLTINIFTLPRKVKLNDESVSLFSETTLEGLKEALKKTLMLEKAEFTGMKINRATPGKRMFTPPRGLHFYN